MFAMKSEAKELYSFRDQKGQQAENELTFSTNAGFEKVIEQRKKGIDFRTLLVAHEDSDGAEIETVA